METFVTIISPMLFGISLLIPWICFLYAKRRIPFKHQLLNYLTLSLVFSVIMSLALASWDHYSKILLLDSYDAYLLNPDSNAYQVGYTLVDPRNMERVKALELSIMGIGWSLKALIAMPMIMGYFLIDYIIRTCFLKFK